MRCTPVITLVVPDSMYEELRHVAALDIETAGVLLARPVSVNGQVRLLARCVRWVPEGAYRRRDAYGLAITSEGYVPALAEAEATGSVPIWLHTHPGEGSSPSPSSHDDIVDRELTDLFRLRSASDYYGTLIIALSEGGLRFTGRVEQTTVAAPIDRVWCVGERFRLIHHAEAASSEVSTQFDRNVRAFGGAVQRVLMDLRVAIVGCGGTGSAAAEQLVRLGVRNFTLFDPDRLSESNITRVYGSTPASVGTLKTETVAENIRGIAPDALVEGVPEMITVKAVARRLAEADIIFGCTDDNSGRLVLSRVATYLMTPVIDCGVLISSTDRGQLQGIDARVTVLHPGAACLVCRGRVDLARAASESMSPDERARRADEGYAPALRGIEPAVVAYTTLTAALAVNELLERLVHYGPPTVPSEVLARVHEREISTNVAPPRPRHYCNMGSGKMGLGLTEPYLEQMWGI